MMIKKIDNVRVAAAEDGVSVEIHRYPTSNVIKLFDGTKSIEEIAFDANWRFTEISEAEHLFGLVKFNYVKDNFSKIFFQFSSAGDATEFEEAFQSCISRRYTELEDATNDKEENELSGDDMRSNVFEAKDDYERNLDLLNSDDISVPNFCSYILPKHPGVGHHPFHLKAGKNASHFVEHFEYEVNNDVKAHWRDAVNYSDSIFKSRLQGDPCLNEYTDVVPPERLPAKLPDLPPICGFDDPPV